MVGGHAYSGREQPTLKLILSRKGFDSSSGGVASPILPDGTLASLPIPDADSPVRYRDLRVGTRNCGEVVESLTRGRVLGGMGAHLDPDLEARARKRSRGWTPVLGQSGAAAGHLRNQGVGVGDLFLFFGWFRSCVEDGPSLRFGPRGTEGGIDVHALFGWLQVGRAIPAPEQKRRELPWAREHPHLHGDRGPGNVLYLAAPTLRLPRSRASRLLPGAGLFSKLHPDRILSRDLSGSKALWKLPRTLRPRAGRPPLSHHGDPRRWKSKAGGVLLRSASRGQEFVLDLDAYPDVLPWLHSLFHGLRSQEPP